MDPSATPLGSVLERVARDPARPLVTDIDLRTDERVELSVASVANGAAKAAHLLRGIGDELGRQPRLELRLPVHWQAVTLALGAWAAGTELVSGSDVGIDAVVLGPEEAEQPPADLPDVVWATRLHPFGLPFATPPAFPVEDLTPALRTQPDAAPVPATDLDAVVLSVEGLALTMTDLLARAADLAAGLGPSDRLLTCLPLTSVGGWLAAAVLPSLADRSVVLARGVDGPGVTTHALERLCATERVVATAGISVPGLPRLC